MLFFLGVLRSHLTLPVFPFPFPYPDLKPRACSPLQTAAASWGSSPAPTRTTGRSSAGPRTASAAWPSRASSMWFPLVSSTPFFYLIFYYFLCLIYLLLFFKIYWDYFFFPCFVCLLTVLFFSRPSSPYILLFSFIISILCTRCFFFYYFFYIFTLPNKLFCSDLRHFFHIWFDSLFSLIVYPSLHIPPLLWIALFPIPLTQLLNFYGLHPSSLPPFDKVLHSPCPCSSFPSVLITQSHPPLSSAAISQLPRELV